MNKIRLALAQINCTVGDIAGNTGIITKYIRKAEDLGADIVSFPELAITGYPPEDLLLKKNFVQDNLEALDKIATVSGDAIVIVGYVDLFADEIYNAAAVIHNGQIKGVYRKIFLPNYGVFDEKRYFAPGRSSTIFKAGDILFGVNICEDIWQADGPTSAQARQGASLLININSSPFHAGKSREREELIKKQAKENEVTISYTNMAGGQDELVFDGHSLIVSPTGRIIARADAFKEDILVADIEISSEAIGASLKAIDVSSSFRIKKQAELTARSTKPMNDTEEIYNALRLGLKDYVGKNGFKKVVIGLSGGIDSSLVAVLASDALGKENVTGVFMPTHYSSEASERDAKALADNLGIKLITIPIENLFKSFLITLDSQFAAAQKDITEENLQARIRGSILMALSNKFGWLVLSTGNKSEMSTGYATLYGDMAGGFAVIKDVPKTLVYILSGYRNSISRVIPQSVIDKEPTAELKPNQKDSDSLPPYDTLDRILKAYIEEDKGIPEILALGIDREMVTKTVSLVEKSEYKRRQSPPGIKITPKAFGRDRRMPITNKFR